MVLLKCRICGGDLKIIDKSSYATCEYCGSTMTLPNIDDERMVNLFNRANHYCLQNEFDKAMAVYENILEEDSSNAEAHWGMVLAKYGIEYVEDPKSNKRIPTCHRLHYEPIYTDFDYKEAIKNSVDNDARTLYEKEAMQISQIQKNILAVARNEDPYDIFICYKETDKDGNRTKDSVFAQDIYDQLVQEKYKVFFSRITLEDKLGTEYEPYIFSALNSSKVMLVVGTTKENFEAVWVKNEWSRFLELLRKDKSKIIIPCYRDMDAYDLPDELSLFQSQDMNKIGFMQDLIRGIRKIINQTSEKQNINVNKIEDNKLNDEERIKFESLLVNARNAVNEYDWVNVNKYYNILKDKFPKDIIIEATFFITVSKCKVLKFPSDEGYINFSQLPNEWKNTFDIIEKCYDESRENKEEILRKISDWLYNLTFSKGEISASKYNPMYYETILIFKEKLENLSYDHDEEYIHNLIEKNKQIITVFENNKLEKKEKRINKFFACWISFIVVIELFIIVGMEAPIFPCLLGVFVYGILPYLIVKLIKKIQNSLN